MKVFQLSVLIFGVLTGRNLAKNFPILAVEENHIFPPIPNILSVVPRHPDGSSGIPPAVPKNPDGTSVVPLAATWYPGDFAGFSTSIPKNTGNHFGVSQGVRSFADETPPVAPAVRKNADGTAADPSETTLRMLCGDESSNIRYDEESKQCFELFTQGPCGKNMRFYASSGVNGECDCLSDAAAPLVYHPRSNQCYYVYQKAYCKRGQWLVFNRNNTPVCTPNPCLNSRLKKQSWAANVRPDVVPLKGDGMCVQLMSNQGCGEDIVTFERNRVVPTCSSSLPNGLQTKFLSPVGILPCPAGSKPSILGNCNPNIEWDF